MDIIWNPKVIPDNEDAVVLIANRHSRMPMKVLGHFQTTRQVDQAAVEFGGSDFGLPFRDAYIKAKAYALAHGIACLYIVDPHGIGANEVRDL